MIDYRKVIVSMVIAVLFSIFVFSLVDAIYPGPDYSECNRAMPLESNDSQIRKIDMESQNCHEALRPERDKHDFVVFLVSVIAGVMAVIVGMYLPVQTPVGMAIASGFLLGGLFTIFFGTMESWNAIGRILRPIVILIELVIVVWVAYKKLQK